MHHQSETLISTLLFYNHKPSRTVLRVSPFRITSVLPVLVQRNLISNYPIFLYVSFIIFITLAIPSVALSFGHHHTFLPAATPSTRLASSRTNLHFHSFISKTAPTENTSPPSSTPPDLWHRPLQIFHSQPFFCNLVGVFKLTFIVCVLRPSLSVMPRPC